MEWSHVTNFLEDLRRRGLKALTIDEYRMGLQSFARYLADIGLFSFFAAQTETIEGFYGRLKSADLSSSTVHRRAHAVCRFYEWLRTEGIILLNPCPTPPKRRTGSLPRRLPHSDGLQTAYRRLHRSEKPHEQRDFAMLDLAYDTGLRRCELHRLNVHDVHTNEGTVRVRGKKDKERVVPIGSRCMKTLLHYIYETRPKLAPEGRTTALFVSWRNGGKRMHPISIDAAFARIRRKYRLDPALTPHALRHAFATDLLTHGAALQDVSRMLGHQKLETTQIYTRLAVRDLKHHHAKYHLRT